MKRSDIARTASAALLVLGAAALPAQGATAAPKAAAKPPAKSASSTAVLKVAPVVYRERRLANGLQVITVETHSSPTVSVHVSYHVGSRDDPPGRSGFAHLFEHMMFKSTANLRAEQFDRLTEDVGGANNASTGDDVGKRRRLEVLDAADPRPLVRMLEVRRRRERVEEPAVR